MNVISAIKPDSSFTHFLFRNTCNRFSLMIISCALIVEMLVFKIIYPNANYIHGDSFSYIDAAHHNLNINIYLIGYSKFLRLFNIFFYSDLALFIFQYLLIQFSSLYLLFTIFYFSNPSRVIKIILLAFMVLNPLALHLANLISSDGLFLALSFIWFTLLLWINYQPSKTIIFWHAIVLFMAFTVRYNAIIYPFISAIAFWYSKIGLKTKVLGYTSAVIMCCYFVVFTSIQYSKLTGFWQYSPFSGWQMANNAMYAYRYVDSSKRKVVPDKFKSLDNMIRTYFDTTRDVKNHPQEALVASTAYMWTPTFPLFKYKDKTQNSETRSIKLKSWAAMGPLYKSYGMHIIIAYPKEYLRYYIWPNTLKYYTPPQEFLEFYNYGKDSIAEVAQSWFHYKHPIVKTRKKDRKIRELIIFPFLSGIINLTMLCTFICYIQLKQINFERTINIVIVMGGIVWIANAIFTIIASSAALRFQAFPILLTTIITSLSIDWMIRLMKQISTNKPNNYKTAQLNIKSSVE